MRRRVVVTGMGLVIPTGIGVGIAWKNVCEGKSGIGRLTRFDPEGFETRIAAEIKDFNPELYIEK
ncbi:MAG: beta-ketoacyl-[acyl-carrier-protein] synthase II, partial [Deltaproteobacteria bacterium]|nr:beta-ketoacyl-[acyl-carrier-protein] synthase II [Deltaproteobacteria bacterium]